ncbi:MAG: Ig-like domain-containing protein [Sandaracinaceae bacterium]
MRRTDRRFQGSSDAGFQGPMPLRSLHVAVPALAAFGLALLLSPRLAAARCGRSHVERFPALNARDVPLNTAIRIVQSDIRGLTGEPGVVRLVSGADQVLLRVVVDQVGFSSRSWVLVPERPLRPNRDYRMQGQLVPGRRVRVRFRTGTQTLTATPTLDGVEAEPLEVVRFGCGPARSVPLRLSLRGATPPAFARIRIAASAAALANGELLGDVVVPVDNGRADLGHGMCSGVWAFVPGQDLVLSVTATNAALAESAPHVVEVRGPPSD